MNNIDALVDAIEAANGLPVPTPRGYAVRIDEQLRTRGYVIFPVDDEGYPIYRAVDNPVDNPGAFHG